MKTAQAERDSAVKAKEEAEGVTAQLTDEVTQLQKSLEGLKTVVTRLEGETKGKGIWPLLSSCRRSTLNGLLSDGQFFFQLSRTRRRS